MKLLHDLVVDYAATHPDKSALEGPRGVMSYGELDARSAALSRRLTELGAGEGSAVAVYVPHIKEIMLGCIAALRTGCIFVPFDDDYPSKRLEYMLEDAGIVALLTTRELWEAKPLDFPQDKVVYLTEVPGTTEPTPTPEGLGLDSPAMLLYTSGTTGKPKGVLHAHRMMLHIADCCKRYPDTAMDERTRSGVMSSFPFVATEMVLLGPLSCGGTVCISPKEARNDLDVLHRFFREARVTHAFLPCSLAAIMAEDYDISGIYVYAAGEKLRNFHALVPGNELINLYGSTEVGPIICKRIRGDEERILVGKPYDNTSTLIVDDDLKPVAGGEVGELLVSNDYMSTGYLHLPELSAEKWIVRDGVRWFRTGDRAAYASDGDIDILGRTDNMVKLRGFRIETGEVEAQVANAVARLGLTDVGQVVVVVKTVSGIQRLTCYYEAPHEIDREAVTAEISDYLAEYMLPDLWMRVDALPRNLNGKVMRNELPQPVLRVGTVSGMDSEVVARVVRTAAAVLGCTNYIGPEDRFTELGGTSLTAMKFVTELRVQGIKIGAAEVLQHDVLRAIADAADVAYEQLWTSAEYDRVVRDFAARGEHIEKVLPISTWQDELLFEQLIFPETNNRRAVVALELDGTISEEHLREALDIIAQEFEELRSSIVYRKVSVIQQVITDRSIPLKVVDKESVDLQELYERYNRMLYARVDPQRNVMLKMLCLHADGKSFLYVISQRISVGQARRRACIARLMQLLEEREPDNESISWWREVLEQALRDLPDDEGAERFSVKQAHVMATEDEHPDIRVYSHDAGPELVFVHTANTGSEAYYRLARRIEDKVSFSAINTYNLYHPDEAVHGISALAAHYIKLLKRQQPEGPYRLGGWCYGGVVAHEMACQLEEAGEDVRLLVMLDSHALDSERLREVSKGMLAEVNRAYFETCPLFAELREGGMLEAMVDNAAHVSEDLRSHTPRHFHGRTLYFRPDVVPAAAKGADYQYWATFMEFEAGNYENYCDRDKLTIVHTPHEHDLMMDDESLDIIVPALLSAVESSS